MIQMFGEMLRKFFIFMKVVIFDKISKKLTKRLERVLFRKFI